MKRRRNRAERLTVLATVLVTALVAGCAPLLDPEYYLLPSLPNVYIYDDFRWSTLDSQPTDEESQWTSGATDGFPEVSAVNAGYFYSFSHRNFLLANTELYGPVRIEVTYQVLRGVVEPSANGDTFDYRIVLASSESTDTSLMGPAVELSFWYDNDGDTLPDSDQLRIRPDTTGTSAPEVAGRPYIDPLETNGKLQIDVNPETGTIHARMFSGTATPDLQVTATVAAIPEPFYLAVQASGDEISPYRARTVDKVTVVDWEAGQ